MTVQFPLNFKVPKSDAQLVSYKNDEIKNRAGPCHKTHANFLAEKVYKVADILTKPAEQGVYWCLAASREGVGKGKNRGPGGVPRKFAVLKAAGWLALTLCILPLTVLGILTKSFIVRPAKDRDVVRFMDATKGPVKNYVPPVIDTDETLHLATLNIAALPPIIDAAKDVTPAGPRMKEFADWLKRQPVEDLPFGFGLQEAFDENAMTTFSRSIRTHFPYAVTSAGWADVPIAGSSSGLAFFSRVPIIGAAFYPFDDLDGFGVKCSARGFLRVELDLGGGKTALVYVTHTQPHSESAHRKIRENELVLIRDQMRYDRLKDIQAGTDRHGHYYLMGDLNVANVDDELVFNENEGRTNEYYDLRQPGGVLSEEMFFDPYLEEHYESGVRKTGTSAHFLEKDVKNDERKAKGWDKISEPEGSFYFGADKSDRTVLQGKGVGSSQDQGGYGTKKFYMRNHPTIPDCRYDYILRLRCWDDVPEDKRYEGESGTGEIRHVIPKKITTMGVSDHLMLSAVFKKAHSQP